VLAEGGIVDGISRIGAIIVPLATSAVAAILALPSVPSARDDIVDLMKPNSGAIPIAV
jgi:hypothetical protein